MSALVSVIMPCFNSSTHIADAVGSALGQSYAPVELIVVDDGSTDDSPQILQRLSDTYGERLRVFTQKNSGPYPARNLALQKARGEFIAFLDADDYWDLDFLQKLHDAIVENDVDVAYCGWRNVGENTPGDRPYIPAPYEDGDLVARFLEGCPWPIHAALVRRREIEKIKGFSERYFSSMDYDLWLRLLTTTMRIKEVPEVLAYYRWHGAGQISAVKWRQVIDAWNVRREFICQNPTLVAHLDQKNLLETADAFLLENAYKALWQRDLGSAHRLFRKALLRGIVGIKDLKYALPTILPRGAFLGLMNLLDRQKEVA